MQIFDGVNSIYISLSHRQKLALIFASFAAFFSLCNVHQTDVNLINFIIFFQIVARFIRS